MSVKKHFGHFSSFHSSIRLIKDMESSVSLFMVKDFPIEIFCQDRSVLRQYAVVHLQIEQRLLNLASPGAREKIRQLKLEGLKTEPAFAAYFHLKGDPYEALVDISSYSDERLREIIGR